MLILTRRTDEEIEIGPNIRVKVVEIRNGSVRLGFIVPDDVTVLRAELIPKIKFDLSAQRQRIVADHSSPAKSAAKP